MFTRSYCDEGIVLARRSWGEADRILSLYTKNHGRVSAIAKSVRKPESKKRGHLEIFGHIRFQIANSKGIGILTEVETLNSFGSVRKDLKKVTLAYFFMEVIGKITHEGETHRELFELTLAYLHRLENEKRLKPLRLEFILRLLTILGFWPKGRALLNPDAKLEEVIERNLFSPRVGKRILA